MTCSSFSFQTSQNNIDLDFKRKLCFSSHKICSLLSKQVFIISLVYLKGSISFHIYLPLLQVMIGTGLRCGELIGLTWKDVDLKTRTVYVNHQLIYKNYGDGCDFHVTMPKTEAGIREIPMSKMVAKAFETQRRLNFQMGIPRDVKIEGLSNFVFMSRSGRPMMPTTVNFILRDIVKAYNEEENERAKRERRKPEELPHISAHGRVIIRTS